MKIIKIETFPITLVVRPEFYIVSSAGAHPISKYVLVAIETDNGLTGWGEATVVPIWSGETQGGAEVLIHEYFKPMLLGRHPGEFQIILKEMDALIGNPFTKAAIEMALLDLVGKMGDRPVYDLLGGAKNSLEIPIKFSIGLREPDNAAKIAAEKVRQGFTAIKIKIGPDPEKDLQRVKAVREAVGADIRINVDVNGGWTVEQAPREISRYADLNLEYVEQPTPRWDIEGMAKVRAQTDVPIMADESVFDIWQAEQVIEKRAADLISIYPGKNGGILKALKICKMAEQNGIGCHLGSNLEWDIGTAAMCQLAAASANVQVARFPVDILGPLYYADHPQDSISFIKGCVSVPRGPGLGIKITEEEIRKLAEISKNRNL